MSKFKSKRTCADTFGADYLDAMSMNGGSFLDQSNRRMFFQAELETMWGFLGTLSGHCSVWATGATFLSKEDK